MTITASTIIDKVRFQVMDPDAIRWTDPELLGWLSDAQRAIAAAVPNASTSVTTLSLVSGPRQTIPSDGYKLLEIYRNLTLLGVSGDSVQEHPFELFKSQYPTWTSDTEVAAVVAYAKHPDDPTAFYVYPPNDATGAVEINYSVMPPTLTSTSDTLVVRDIFEPALVDYVMSRAHAKDSDYAGGEGVAARYLNQFTAYVATQLTPGG